MSARNQAAFYANTRQARPPSLMRAFGAGLAMIGTTLLAGASGAAEHDESPDAGDLPATAQATLGPDGAALDAINGEIESDADQDMFEIFIDDPVTFSASTNNAGTTLPGGDTMLFLFDENGLGVVASDDIDGLNFKTTLAAGSLADAGGVAGVYYIAISKAFTVPSSDAGDPASGELWNPDRLGEATDTLDFDFIPNRGPGWDLAVASWFPFPFNDFAGSYRIELTGASFVPEPSSALGLAIGALGLAGCARQRRRREGP